MTAYRSFPIMCSVNKIRIEGISIYQLLANKRFNINTLVLEKGEFMLNKNLKHKATEDKPERIALKSLAIKRIVLREIYAKVAADSLIQFEGVVTLRWKNIVLDDLKKALDISSYQIEAFDTQITNAIIKGKKACTIQRFQDQCQQQRTRDRNRFIDHDSTIFQVQVCAKGRPTRGPI
jgi:hypothetical protein